MARIARKTLCTFISTVVSEKNDSENWREIQKGKDSNVKIKKGNRKIIQKVNFAARSNIDITIGINSKENNENKKERQK